MLYYKNVRNRPCWVLSGLHNVNFESKHTNNNNRVWYQHWNTKVSIAVICLTCCEDRTRLIFTERDQIHERSDNRSDINIRIISKNRVYLVQTIHTLIRHLPNTYELTRLRTYFLRNLKKMTTRAARKLIDWNKHVHFNENSCPLQPNAITIYWTILCPQFTI